MRILRPRSAPRGHKTVSQRLSARQWEALNRMLPLRGLCVCVCAMAVPVLSKNRLSHLLPAKEQNPPCEEQQDKQTVGREGGRCSSVPVPGRVRVAEVRRK